METVATVIDFVQFAKSCLDFYQEARLNTPQSHNELRLRLEVEAICFERWCAASGLSIVTRKSGDLRSDWQSSTTLKDLQAQLQRTLRFNSPEIAALVVSVLRGLEDKFDQARERLRPGSAKEPANTKSKAKGLWKRLTYKSDSNGNKSPEQGQIGIFGATRFLLWDKKYFTQLLSELESTNNALLKLLDEDLQRQVQRRVRLQVLGTRGSATLQTAQQLAIQRIGHFEDEVVGTLAELKQAHLTDDAGRKSSDSQHTSTQEAPSTTRIATYPIEEFPPQILQTKATRVVTQFLQKSVLVEWKASSPSHPLPFQAIIRLGSLVNLLHRRKMYERFHILRCRGLVEDRQNHRVGIIFDIPSPGDTGPAWTSLQTVISETGTSVPSITDRLTVAIRMCIALHYLQSVNWLHKSLRSDNVICFGYQKPEPPRRLMLTNAGNTSLSSQNVDQQTMAKKSPRGTPAMDDDNNDDDGESSLPRLPPFYLVGLDLSRPDHPSELSETMSVYTSAHRTMGENIALYSHPESLGPEGSQTRPRYQARFDIYSFGLILLEIGLWRTLSDMKKSSVRDGLDFRTQFHTKYCGMLRQAMGDIYWRVTKRCLNNDFDLEDAPEGTESGLTLQLAFERQVLSELERCNV